MPDMSLDNRIRLATFAFLEEQERVHGEMLPRTLLADGFDFEGTHIHLLSAQGIFKPKILEFPLSIVTTPDNPYEDSDSSPNTLDYRYRGSDPQHRDNVGLRECMRRKLPLVYFLGLSPGWYMPMWPVYIVGDSQERLTFTVTVDDRMLVRTSEQGADVLTDTGADIRRAYVMTTVRRRIHQNAFRERVLKAYKTQCALCRLRHRELLDAAHIVPDNDPQGEPKVSNGLSLCRIHHAAYDSNIVGIRPDYVVEVPRRILEEEDGPMLRHGLQEIHESHIILPRSVSDRPDPDLLERRYDGFREAQ